MREIIFKCWSALANPLHRYAKTALASLREAALISVINFVPAIVGVAFFAAGFVPALGLILLIESAGLMLVGGALSFSGQKGVRKLVSAMTNLDLGSEKDGTDADMKAALYSLTGVLLFAESLILAFVLT